ncbi:hypothetical protein BJV78DRAFT_752103 [Lactifluus subvellereus]|nr:hypothetical protein BJV78DRAFT_752103 [Lactifluus subvellereus]
MRYLASILDQIGTVLTSDDTRRRPRLPNHTVLILNVPSTFPRLGTSPDPMSSPRTSSPLNSNSHSVPLTDPAFAYLTLPYYIPGSGAYTPTLFCRSRDPLPVHDALIPISCVTSAPAAPHCYAPVLPLPLAPQGHHIPYYYNLLCL